MTTELNLRELATKLTGDAMYELMAHWMLHAEREILTGQLEDDNEREMAKAILSDSEALANQCANVLSGLGVEEATNQYIVEFAPSYSR